VSSVLSAPHSANEKPSWLDTLPPKVSINPQEKICKNVLSVSIKSSETGTIWYGIGAIKFIKQYKKPFSITRDGTYKIYFYAEDDFGNASAMDSIEYLIDTKPPVLTITPPQGTFREPVMLHVTANEHCQLFLLKKNGAGAGTKFNDSLLVTTAEELRIRAVDEAGNSSISKPFTYSIDTTSLIFSIDPVGGIYNRPLNISFNFKKDITIWYTFDPLASQRWFTKYTDPVKLPYGLSSIRYYAKSPSGFSSEIFNSRYIVDTIAPKLTKKILPGISQDTIYFSTREKTEIRYTRDGTFPVKESPLYEKPLIIKRSGVQRIKARAWDIAGNSSEIFEWEYKYDLIPPEISIIPASGTYKSPFTIKITANEPSRILYTIDKTPPGKNSLIYQNEGIIVSREDSTILRAIAIDSAGNSSKELCMNYFLDSKPPVLKARIDGSLKEGLFTVSLFSDGPSTIYYEIGNREPTEASAKYDQPLQLTTNQVLKYFAVDNFGNRSKTYIMDELYKPMIEVMPGAGIHNRKISISFSTNIPGTVYWRILPDTVFSPAKEDVGLDKEGTYTLEYYLETNGGQRSSIYRQEYHLDWTPPAVEVRTKKGLNDSAIVFLRSSERATYYYTIDGTNPLVSSTVNTAGNKFLQNNDRLIFKKNADMKLSIFAEDAAGNQSALSVLDIFSPRAIPDIPASTKTVYDKAISVSFQTFDESSIFYTTDGSTPTQTSTLFDRPVTLMSSDTIQTLVVDASGFIGKVDTFIYRVDLPPTPFFTIKNRDIFVRDTVYFDASESFDKETPQSGLLFRWDFDGNGTYDTDTLKTTQTKFQYTHPGFYKVKLETIDEMKRSSKIINDCVVKERCPDDMVSITIENQKLFCIDKYEWPNHQKSIPLTGVSWVQAKMYCIDAGKRLCTQKEWESACNGGSELLYPYGNTFQKERCPVDGNVVWKSGSFSKCENTGVSDMVGNVWEWIENKKGDYPLSMGGSFRYGKIARCNLQSQGTVATQSNETGFRCCK
jgi:hypothetical protein